jgi:hypothetical protein
MRHSTLQSIGTPKRMTQTTRYFVMSMTLAALGPAANAAASDHGRVPCTGGILENLSREAIVKTLAGPEGLAGTVHGIPPDRNGSTAILTVRDPNDFFQAKQLSLIPQNPETAEFFGLVNRNDTVCIKGRAAPFGADQIHLFVTEAAVLEVMPDRYPELPPYVYTGPTPNVLPQSGQIQARIHGVEEGLLVIEVGDRVMPLFLPANTNLGAEPWRFDVVTLSYRKRPMPGGLSHLELDRSASNPFQVTSSIRAQNGSEVTLTGTLAMFPKSPLITLDTFALSRQEGGFETTYTLVNLVDPEIFAAIRAKLAAAWDAPSSSITRGRNHFLNSSVKVTARGTLNMVSPSQANPQILIESIDDVVIDTSDER